jgi:anti-sigma factor RsiW
MATEACHRYRGAIGALVLGHLDPDEEAALRAHASGCEACRGEIEALEPVARLLLRADPDRVGATPPPPPASLGIGVSNRLAGERRARLGRRLGFAGVATALAGAAAAAILATGPSDESLAARTVQFDTGDPSIALTATLGSRPWGTEVELAVRGMHEGTRCRVWLISEREGRVSAGSFVYRYGEGSAGASLTSALPGSSVDAIEVKAGRRTFEAPLD